MDKLISTAKAVDTVFKVVSIALKILLVTSLVCLAIVAAGAIFDLPPEMIGTGFDAIEVGDLTFHVAEGCGPVFGDLLLQIGIVLAMGAAVAALGVRAVKAVRAMLKPMKEGQPFHREVSVNLRKLGVFSIVMGAALNVMKAVTLYSTAALCGLKTLLTSEKIVRVDVNVQFDLTFLVMAAAFFLLSYVFRYGAELQQLSDETL